MTKSDLTLIKNALFQIEMREAELIDSFPDVDLPRSDRYLENMASIRCQATDKRKKQITKRIIIAVIAAALLLLTACAIKEPVLDFVEKVYEKYTSLYSDVGNVETLETMYIPSYIPEGYVVRSRYEGLTVFQVSWRNKENEIISYQQNPLYNNIVSIDTEEQDYSIMYIGAQKVYCISKAQSYLFVWEDDFYSFQLQCPSSIQMDEIEQIFLSIREQPKETAEKD